MDREIAEAEAARKDPKELRTARKHLVEVEKELAKAQQRRGGRLTVHLLDDKPLELQV